MRYLDVNSDDKIIITTIKKDIINYEIYKIIKNHYQSKKVKFVHSKILFYIYRVLFKLRNKFFFFNHFIANIEWYHHEIGFEKNYGALHRFYDLKSFQQKSKIGVLEEQTRQFNLWKKSNLPDGKFVVFFSRDSGYYNDKNNPRNSDFNRYRKSIDYLILKGFLIIRMGRNHNDNFQYENKNFFDYSKLCNYRYDDLIELMIFKNCEFIVGSVTGMLTYSTLFDKPLLINNWFPAGYLPWFRNSNFIPKLYKKNSAYINFNKIPKNLLLSEDENILQFNSLEISENSEEEIFEQIFNYIEYGFKVGFELKNNDYFVCGPVAKMDKSFFQKYNHLF